MQLKPTIRRVLANSVPYGEGICTRGKHVWAVYNGKDEVIGVAATKKEARVVELKAMGVYGRPLPAWSMEHSTSKEARTLAHKLRPDEKL